MSGNSQAVLDNFWNKYRLPGSRPSQDHEPPIGQPTPEDEPPAWQPTPEDAPLVVQLAPEPYLIPSFKATGKTPRASGKRQAKKKAKLTKTYAEVTEPAGPVGAKHVTSAVTNEPPKSF